MQATSFLHLVVAFVYAVIYVTVGAERWSQPLGDSQVLPWLYAVLVYGNLIFVGHWLLRLPFRLLRFDALARWFPLWLLGAALITLERTVEVNLNLPPLIGWTDSVRVDLLVRSTSQGLVAATIWVGLLAWMVRGFPRLSPGRRTGWFGWTQGLITAVWIVWNATGIGPGKLEAVDRAGAPTAGRGMTLICVDAAYWGIVDELITEGRLPHIKALRDRGTYGHLITHGQRLSPIVWTSLVTGMAESGHGVHGWTEPALDGKRTIVVQSTSRTAAAVWNMADHVGLSSLVLNWLVTSPPESIDGAVIPNLDDVFQGVVPVTHPPLWQDAVMAESKRAGYLHDDPVIEPLQLVDFVDRTYQMATDGTGYDLVVTGTQATDHVQHRYFLHRYPDLFDKAQWSMDEADMERFADLIAATYERTDKWVGQLVADGKAVMIVSDHGARPRSQPFAVFNLNHLLEDMGLSHRLPIREGRKGSKRADADSSLVYSIGFDAWQNELALYVNEDNLAGVEYPGDEELIRRLLDLRIAETGAPLFDDVVIFGTDKVPARQRKNARAGARGYVSLSSVCRQLPHDFTVDIEGRVFRLDRYIRLRQQINGSHDPRGLFLLAGPDLPARGAIDKPALDTSLSEILRWIVGVHPLLDVVADGFRYLGLMDPYTSLDVTPTILAYLGLPVAADMDGRIMARSLEGADYTSMEVPTYDALLQGLGNGQEPSEADNEQMLERLRALGYIN